MDASEIKEKLKVIESEMHESHEKVTQVDLLDSIHAATLDRIAAKHIGIRNQINELIKACNTKEHCLKWSVTSYTVHKRSPLWPSFLQRCG